MDDVEELKTRVGLLEEKMEAHIKEHKKALEQISSKVDEATETYRAIAHIEGLAKIIKSVGDWSKWISIIIAGGAILSEFFGYGIGVSLISK